MAKSNSMKIKVALLFGGKSAEHDISVISALQAYRHLNKDKYDVYPIYITKDGEMFFGEDTGKIEAYSDIDKLLKNSRRVSFTRNSGRVQLVYEKKAKFIADLDVALPVVHGTNVEDGTVQGYLQLLGLPYGGCDILSSAIGMDKYVTKTVLREAGIPVLDCVRARIAEYNSDSEAVIAKIEEKIGYPVIVKPINCGSSIGISKASDRDSLEEALADAFTYSDRILAERAIVNLREINCAVLGDGDLAEASECEEPVGSDEILSFNDKYVGGAKGSAKGGAKTNEDAKGMASLKRKIPAPITDEQRDYIRKTAVDAFQALGCGGVSRIDFLLDSSTGEIFFNEINTIPGSLSFYLWEPLGVKYTELLDKIIALALKRDRQNRALTYTFESSVLSGISFGGTKGAKGCKG